MANTEHAITDEDVRAAQVLLDLVQEVTGCPTGHRLDARGAVAVHVSEIRAAGYLQGRTDVLDAQAALECPAWAGNHVPTMIGTCALCGKPVEP